jgi:hypothetical protein
MCPKNSSRGVERQILPKAGLLLSFLGCVVVFVTLVLYL